MRELFEEWVIGQFGIEPSRLEVFHHKDGYADHNINLIWVGFNGGVELAPLATK